MVSVGQKFDGERLQLHVFPSPGPDLDPTASVPRYRRDGVECCCNLTGQTIGSAMSA